MGKVISPYDLAGNTERSQQVALFCQAALHVNKYPCLKWLHAIPNANSHTQVVEGVRAGVADMFLPYARPTDTRPNVWSEIAFYGLYIELKTEKRRKEKNGGLSDEQIQFGIDIKQAGYQWFVCYGWQEAWQRIEEYLNG